MHRITTERKLENAIVLIVDDQPINLEILDVHLSKHFNIVRASSGQEAIDYCRKNPPDLIVMDVVMPGLDGLEACRQLKADKNLCDIPVIFSTSLSTPSDQTNCWNVGGSDFVAKPIHPQTLIQRIRVHAKLKIQTDILKSQVYLDGLTSIYNRLYLDEHSVKLFQQAQRAEVPLSVLMIDIDYFKKFNDMYGHLEGDNCLRAIAKTLSASTERPIDLVCRYGGEEFCCLLPETNKRGAEKIATKMCDAIASLEIEHTESPYKKISISIGIAVSSEDSAHIIEVMNYADKNLYQAKLNGRKGWVS